METALLNTVIGMGVVFVVLIFISLIISLFGLIPKIMERSAKKKNGIAQQAVGASAQAVKATAPQAVKTDDTELVAVIAAAVAAAMSDEIGQPVAADGLVIRSIKRRR